MSNELLQRIIKNSTIKETSVLASSTFFNDLDMFSTSIPALNVALSGSLTGGVTSGLTMFAGPSKHFKTMFSLILAKAFLDKHIDGVLIFFDSEFGTPKSYFETLKIDTSRVVHVPLTDVEVLKFEIMRQLSEIKRGDKVMFVIDSIGNLASKKEIEDSLNEKSVSDMTRAKQLKSLFRMLTPHLVIKNLPMVVVNHTYKEISLFPKDIVGGGTGSYYASNNIFIIGRQQEKDGTELAGYNFIINVEKSRFVREKAKIPITVRYEGGLSTWSGLLEMALESKIVVKPSNGWYCRVLGDGGEPEAKRWRAKETDSKDFWMPILGNVKFQQWIKDTYQVASDTFVTDEQIDADVADTLLNDQ